MLQPTELPAPTGAALKVSRALRGHIMQAMADAGGYIRFDRYMQMALYQPALGYYMGGAVKFGRAGDFVTAPEISRLFGRCLAREAHAILARTGGAILEVGGGSGALAASVLAQLAELDALPERYIIVELSPDLRERQRASIAGSGNALVERVEWLQRMPEQAIDGLIIANEIIDAFPVRCFKTRAGRVYERCVEARDNGFAWCDVPASPEFEEQVRRRVAPSIIDAESTYISEWNIGIEPWISDLARLTNKGVALIIDYGLPRREYYHEARNAGTLLCHYRHRAHNDPFLFPGLQDITASVDFTDVASQAHNSGLRVLGFSEQSSFLLSNALLDDVEEQRAKVDGAARERLVFETKMLTLPTEMGARFKVLALGKDYDAPLSGFNLRDDRQRL